MEGLEIPRNTIAILKKYNINFQKRYGQNFLIDAHVLEKIVDAADITGDDFVLEIGPGIGTLTRRLCERAGEVAAVEIDRKLLPALEETLAGYGNVSVLNKDILKVDIAQLISGKAKGRPAKIVANLPYYITTPVILRIFEGNVPAGSVTVMVQKEVAGRMLAGPGTKDYGALSLAVQYHAKVKVIADVSPSCFLPQPKVGSAVVHLERHEDAPVRAKDEQLMFQIIRASFNQRRKTLANGLANAPGIPLSREDVKECLQEMGLPGAVRGEALDLAQFAAFSDKVSDFLNLSRRDNND